MITIDYDGRIPQRVREIGRKIVLGREFGSFDMSAPVGIGVANVKNKNATTTMDFARGVDLNPAEPFRLSHDPSFFRYGVAAAR
jgi:hypothetical protein